MAERQCGKTFAAGIRVMSTRPSKLRPGQKVLVKELVGNRSNIAFFVRREPARGKGRPAVNYLRFPCFIGLDGSDDGGVCVMSDYDLSRRGVVDNCASGIKPQGNNNNEEVLQ